MSRSSRAHARIASPSRTTSPSSSSRPSHQPPCSRARRFPARRHRRHPPPLRARQRPPRHRPRGHALQRPLGRGQARHPARPRGRRDWLWDFRHRPARSRIHRRRWPLLRRRRAARTRRTATPVRTGPTAPLRARRPRRPPRRRSCVSRMRLFLRTCTLTATGCLDDLPSRHELVQQYTPSTLYSMPTVFPRAKFVRAYRWGNLTCSTPRTATLSRSGLLSFITWKCVPLSPPPRAQALIIMADCLSVL